MHELSVVMGIVGIAEAETARAGAKKVERIELEIGTLSGVELSALEFAWRQAVRNTVLEGAVKEIDIIQARGRCLECEKEFPLKEVYDPCPICQNYAKGIVQGKELKVRALEVV